MVVGTAKRVAQERVACSESIQDSVVRPNYAIRFQSSNVILVPDEPSLDEKSCILLLEIVWNWQRVFEVHLNLSFLLPYTMHCKDANK